MKGIVVVFAVAAFFAVVFVSCGSTPKPDSEAVESEIDDGQISGEASGEVENTDVNANENSDLNSELDVAEANQTALEKAETARQAAVDAGADAAFPEKFAEIDALYNSARERAEAGENVSSELDKIGKLYAALEQYALAKGAKDKIEENNFADYDRASYDKGCAFLSTAEELFQDAFANDNEFLEAATNANGQFKNVIFEAYRTLAKDERTNAFIAKRNADAIRAGVAAKEEYNAAVDEFRKGDSAYSMQNPESAYGHYMAARERFSTVFDVVSEIRANAERAMVDSQKIVDDAYLYAENADKNAPLEGDDIEGIESADAVLLESDVYENPESLEADIPEDIDSEEGLQTEVVEEAAAKEIEATSGDAAVEEDFVESAETVEGGEAAIPKEECFETEETVGEPEPVVEEAEDEMVTEGQLDDTADNTEREVEVIEEIIKPVENTPSQGEDETMQDVEQEPIDETEGDATGSIEEVVSEGEIDIVDGDAEAKMQLESAEEEELGETMPMEAQESTVEIVVEESEAADTPTETASGVDEQTDSAAENGEAEDTVDGRQTEEAAVEPFEQDETPFVEEE